MVRAVSTARPVSMKNEILIKTTKQRKERNMIDQDYWREYERFWDEFVLDWFKEMQSRSNSRTECRNPYGDEKHISRVFAKLISDLNFDELPEPYLGSPTKIKRFDAVLINLNPGASAHDENANSLDVTKLYSNFGTDAGRLINEFMNSQSRVGMHTYSQFISQVGQYGGWSSLNPRLRGVVPEVCGVKWWQGNNPKRIGGKRIPWLRRIYQTNVEPEKIFALELCPYHSVGFGLNNRDGIAKKTLWDFIAERVIKPAATAVVESNLPFALAVGKGVADILDNVGADFVKEWSYKTPIVGWPENSSGELIMRTYRRYVVEAHNGQKADIIVTWLKNNRGIPAPGKEFDGVERLIRNDCGTSNEDITLTDGTEIAICSQWGRAHGAGNIPRFLERARELGYEIEEVPPEER